MFNCSYCGQEIKQIGVNNINGHYHLICHLKNKGEIVIDNLDHADLYTSNDINDAYKEGIYKGTKDINETYNKGLFEGIVGGVIIGTVMGVVGAAISFLK